MRVRMRVRVRVKVRVHPRRQTVGLVSSDARPVFVQVKRGASRRQACMLWSTFTWQPSLMTRIASND